MIATLPLAVLAAFGVDRFRRPTLRRVVAALCLVGIVLDGPAGVFHYDPASAEFLRDLPPGATLLDLPPFDPGHFSGSGYAFALTVNPGPRPGGYNPFVTSVIREAQATTAALASAPVDACRWRAVSTIMGIRYVAIHLDLYGPHALQWPADGAALVASLDNSPGFVRLSEDERVVLYRLEPERFDCEAP